ncbi:MAG: N-acetylmuramic acid 6-phosphate etherase [Eubacteriales bacterium]|nr:N-acetylmuramic acid 6-phosphate etherase [Eubacteriales bacterium]
MPTNQKAKIDLSQLTTESRNPESSRLDEMSALEIATLMNREDQKVPLAIQPILGDIALVIERVAAAFQNGGRLFYIGAGTSGRLAVLDAAECPPTFGVSPDLVVALIAGGEKAFVQAVEGAEDSLELAARDLRAKNLTANDVVIGLAASGRTPYVLGGLNYAKSLGAFTAAIACNRNSEIGRVADLALEIIVGPEVLSGSSRLKAGTAQKLVLNMISTGAMVLCGKCYQNLMVDVVQSNEKLKVRAENIVMEVCGESRERARAAIDAADGELKTAIVSLMLGSTPAVARARLAEHGGHVRKASQDK